MAALDRTMIANLRHRRRGDAVAESTRSALLLLRPDIRAADGVPAEAIGLAAARGAEAGVVVVQVLRLHGSAWGLPNPGLMPSPQERNAADARVGSALAALRRKGIDADGQILVTRQDAKGVARIAARRGVSALVVEQRASSRLRALLEGDIARSLSRRLGPGVEIVTVAPRQ